MAEMRFLSNQSQIYLARCKKRDKCLVSLTFYHFLPIRLIKSIKHEQSCKILHVKPCQENPTVGSIDQCGTEPIYGVLVVSFF